jgi:hypothetical protein
MTSLVLRSGYERKEFEALPNLSCGGKRKLRTQILVQR